MEKVLREIGERVKQARLACGLSQADLAEKLNLTSAFGIRNGARTITWPSPLI